MMHFPSSLARCWRALLWAGLTLIAVGDTARAQVVISEFMAANVRTLADRDRDFSDWIELFNPGQAPAGLEGWFLTDNRSQPKKWPLPAVTIGPGEYLIVFASGKDRRNTGAELHTNFKLDADGGYLALVKPDGSSVASEFKYPQQVGGASYGLMMTERPAPVVAPGAPARLHVPTADIGMKWTTAEFDDATWQAASGRIAFGNGATEAGSPAPWLHERMAKNPSVYARWPFELKEGAVESLRLRVRADDGFVAYLNGWEVARTNAPAKPAWNSQAAGARGGGGAVAQVEAFDGRGAGTFVMSQLDPSTAPKIFPGQDGAGYLRLLNGRMANQANGVAFPQAAPGLFESVQAEFDFRWRASGDSTERLAFLLIPVGLYGATGPGVDLGVLRDQKDAKYPGVLAVQLLHDPAGGKKALTVYWDRARVTTVDLPANLFAQRLFHRARIRIARSGQGALLTVGLISDVRGVGKTEHQAVAALAIPGMAPFQPRAQFVARAGNVDQTVDLSEVRLEFRAAGATKLDEFDLTPFLNVMRPGRNVLAIHGLNSSAADANFALEPELFAVQGNVRAKEGRYFAAPTPRSSNGDGVTALSPPPVFGRRGGVFSSPVSMELSAAHGTVRYTLDGSEPTVTSEAYSQPVNLTSTTLVKAKNFVLGSLPSATATETFTVLDETAAAFRSGFPLLVLNPFGKYISSGNRTLASIQIIEPGKDGAATLAGKLDYDGRASVNVRGFSTLRQPKNSLTVRLVDENGSKVKAPLLGMPKESDWVLYAPYADKTLMRDVLAYELSNAMGRYAPRTRFVEVFIDRSGGKLARRDYMGVYVLIEKIKRDKNRVNIAAADGGAARTADPAFIIKRDHSDRYEPSFRTSRGNHFFYVYPDPEEMSREQMNGISRYMSRVEASIYGDDFRDPAKGYAALLDVDAFIDQHLLIEMSKNIDGFRYSAFVHRDRGGKLIVGPAWDWNLSFGNADYYDASDPSGWYTDQLRESEICWYRRLSEDPEFMQRTIDRWGQLRRGALGTARILARVDELAAQLNEAQERNFTRWPIMGRRVNPNDFVGDSYAEEVKWMKQWIQKRLDWMDRQFPAAPVISEAQGQVTLKGAGKIYYTLDGSDPRLPGGGVSGKATAYSSPLKMSDASKLTVRAHRGSTWSAPVSARGK